MNITIRNQKWTVEDAWCLENCIGSTIYSEQKIKILNNLPKETRKATIIHELTRAVMWVYGFGQHGSLNREQICDFFASHGEEIMMLAKKIIKEKE